MLLNAWAHISPGVVITGDQHPQEEHCVWDRVFPIKSRLLRILSVLPRQWACLCLSVFRVAELLTPSGVKQTGTGVCSCSAQASWFLQPQRFAAFPIHKKGGWVGRSAVCR